MQGTQEENSELRMRRAEKAKRDNEAIASQTGNIRCYGKTGFFAPITQPDGKVVKKFFYGREGD